MLFRSLFFSVLIGLLGSFAGAGAGCLFVSRANEMESWLFERFGWQLWDRSVYAIGEIPSKIEPDVICIIVLCAVFASVAGAFLPSFQAARRQISRVLAVNQL